MGHSDLHVFRGQMTGTSVEGVSEDLSIDADCTVDWCGRNGMVVHAGKTKAMLASTV